MEKLNILIASDSFKGSLSSRGVANAIIEGLEEVKKNIDIDLAYHVFEIADGGEGTVEAITNSLNGEILEFNVKDVFYNETKAILGKLDDDTCILETASPCGLDKIDSNNLDPMNATTYGLGEMIKHALDEKFKKIYIGLGGSATNDGGIGIALALGAKILNKEGKQVSLGAKGLAEVYDIDLSNLDKRLKETEFILLSDVKNVLIGTNGATPIYGPQKGVKESDIKIIDSWMENYGKLLEKASGKSIINVKSSGAAGGIGAALIALTNAKVEKGIEAIMDILNMEEYIKKADLVFTGEGKMDGQSLNGKAPLGVAKVGKKYKKPVYAIVGSKGDGYEKALDYGIDIVLDIVDKPMELIEAIKNVKKLVSRQAYLSLRQYLSLKEKFKIK